MTASATPTTPVVATPKVKTPKWTPMSDADAARAAATARPAINPCLCGCGETTKGRFTPGHDALHHQRLLATATGGTAKAKASAKAALVAFGWDLPKA